LTTLGGIICLRGQKKTKWQERLANPPMRRLAMKKINLAILLLICLVSTVRSQEKTPKLLVRAAHCLAVKNNFPSSKAATLSFGYLLDEKSYPGEKVLYAVNYATTTRSNGSVFAIFLTERDGRQIFNIQNNASFVLSKDDSVGVSFTDPPLGGTWTQEHLAAAIKQIEKQPVFVISVKDILAASPLTDCESYTDR
jgi:hypothetical protein